MRDDTGEVGAYLSHAQKRILRFLKIPRVHDFYHFLLKDVEIFFEIIIFISFNNIIDFYISLLLSIPDDQLTRQITWMMIDPPHLINYMLTLYWEGYFFTLIPGGGGHICLPKNRQNGPFYV